MDKLIELLNEYEKSITEIPVCWEKTNGILQYWSYIQQVSVMYMISKHYGFIKRLVNNNKIDMKKHFYDKMNCVWYPDLNIVLCELAISDTPIDDLISYLK